MLCEKIITRLLLPAFIVMLALASCVEDRLDDDLAAGELPSTPRKSQYVIALDIQTMGDIQTRASHSTDEFEDADLSKDSDNPIPSGDFVYGTEEEHELIGPTGNYIFLFRVETDEDGNVVEPEKLVAIADILLPTHSHNPADSANSGGGVKDENGDIEENIEARYECRFNVRDDELPTSCLLLLNGKHIKLNDRLLGDGLDAINEAIADENSPECQYTAADIIEKLVDDGNGTPLNIGHDDFDTDGKPKYFTMSNSIYVKDGELHTSVPITADMIQESGSYDPTNVLTIYVERMVAKFTFRLPEKQADDYKAQEYDGDYKRIWRPGVEPLNLFDSIDEEDGGINAYQVDWHVVLKGWGINGLETENYVYKHIDVDGTNYPDGWKDADNYRTYWSVDPHYEGTEYPWQFRNMFDCTSSDYPNFLYYDEKYTSADNDKNTLRNYSYNQLKERSNSNFDRVVYTPENTYDYLSAKDDFKEALDERPHRLAGTHLLVGAVLQTDFSEVVAGMDEAEQEKYHEEYDGKDADDEGNFRAHDLFRDRTGIYYRKESHCLQSLVHSFNRTLSSQSSMEFTYYNWDDNRDERNGTRYAIRPTADASAELNFSDDVTYSLYLDGEPLTYKNVPGFEYDEDDKDYHLLAKAEIKDGDGRRMPWVDEWWEDGLELTIQCDEQHILTDVYDLREDESDTWEKIPNFTVDKNVIKSLLYEWLGAVDHFHYGKMYYSAPVKNLRNANDDEPFYGVVRNSWYCFVLSGVSSIGTSVDDPNQPIVPLVVDTHDQINVRIELLDWHTVEHDVPVLDDKYLQ